MSDEGMGQAVQEQPAPEPEKGFEDPQKELLEAAQELCTKMDRVHDAPEFRGMWVLAHVHGIDYAGPTYEKEFARLKNIVNSMSGSPEPGE